MDTNTNSSARAGTDDGLATTDDARRWGADDSVSERVNDRVRRWVQGMEEAVARVASGSPGYGDRH
jgi:hypothetical protein